MKILYIDAEYDDGREAVRNCVEGRKAWLEALDHEVDISGNLSILEHLSTSQIKEYDEVVINLGIEGESYDLLPGIKELKRKYPSKISIGLSLPTNVTFISNNPKNSLDALAHEAEFALLQDYGQAVTSGFSDLRLAEIRTGKAPASLLTAPQLANTPG